jgi:hypothetical protein
MFEVIPVTVPAVAVRPADPETDKFPAFAVFLDSPKMSYRSKNGYRKPQLDLLNEIVIFGNSPGTLIAIGLKCSTNVMVYSQLRMVQNSKS